VEYVIPDGLLHDGVHAFEPPVSGYLQIYGATSLPANRAIPTQTRARAQALVRPPPIGDIHEPTDLPPDGTCKWGRHPSCARPAGPGRLRPQQPAAGRHGDHQRHRRAPGDQRGEQPCAVHDRAGRHTGSPSAGWRAPAWSGRCTPRRSTGWKPPGSESPCATETTGQSASPSSTTPGLTQEPRHRPVVVPPCRAAAHPSVNIRTASPKRPTVTPDSQMTACRGRPPAVPTVLMAAHARASIRSRVERATTSL
jgi:hypothetical protein